MSLVTLGEICTEVPTTGIDGAGADSADVEHDEIGDIDDEKIWVNRFELDVDGVDAGEV